MTTYLECWIGSAAALFSQALAGEPQLAESPQCAFESGSFAFAATLGGDNVGQFVVIVDRGVLASPLLGEGVEQKSSWGEVLREVAESAAGDLLVKTGRKCRVEEFHEISGPEEGASASTCTRSLLLKGRERSWSLQVRDELHDKVSPPQPEQKAPSPSSAPQPSPTAPAADHAGLDLLLDVELEATLRFGCRELPLGEVLDLGPGDVVQLDRAVSDPVDLVVGDKIVARGEVVLVNGNFGLRVTEVATPRRRLESIRCLF